MIWHKINWDDKTTLPKRPGTYMCRVLTPGNYGRENVSYMTLSFSFNICYYFSCDSMIVTHWAEDFSIPEDVRV